MALGFPITPVDAGRVNPGCRISKLFRELDELEFLSLASIVDENIPRPGRTVEGNESLETTIWLDPLGNFGLVPLLFESLSRKSK